MNNPLKRTILDILKQAKSPLKEYDLHQALDGKAFAQFVRDCDEQVTLFRKHFLIMNALYELYDELAEQSIHLTISALDIRLSPASEYSRKSISTDTGFIKLKQYYTDWDNFYHTQSQDISELLQQFWHRFLSLEEKTLSLKCLELEAQATWPEIQQQYRRLCQQQHPDKGGESMRFLEIREAYENLRMLYQPNQITVRRR
jgi:hypothetical protein